MESPSEPPSPASPKPAGDDPKDRILKASTLDVLAGSSRSALLELGRVERVGRRQRIVQQGEPTKALVVLSAGRVKLERMRAGRAVPLGHRGPGETVGETALGTSPVATESAIVVDEVEAIVLPLSGVRRLMTTDAALRMALADLIVVRRRAAEDRLEALLLRSVETRLASFLVDALDRWGRHHDSGELIGAPFTHADIALLIGSTRETVTLLLGKLKRAGVLEFDKRRVVIRDRAALERHRVAG